jgi:DNA-binding NarL/FixJ family response regulator
MNGPNQSTAQQEHRIRVLIVDDHAVLRQGLCALIEKIPDLQVVGEAANGLEAIELARKSKPDVILMDLLLPGLAGIQATRKILETSPQARILVLTGAAHSQHQVHLCLEAGACGYLLKSSSGPEIFSAIRQAHAGQLAFGSNICQVVQSSPESSLALDQTPPPLAAVPGRQSELSPRERQVLCLLADGKTNDEAAKTLAISIKTVEKHRQRVMDKLDLHNIAALTRYAIARGLVQELP